MDGLTEFWLWIKPVLIVLAGAVVFFLVAWWNSIPRDGDEPLDF